ncbi:hypothetical protein U9M48_019913 [Paspalum notatum var. saurae]|uniref:Leucine-rich repeat-containing N-terminal plant-type domain-containing protein n=1 Tax=Paspalum notatum var. saurae TaxID=547442 RepID=A0AAQ3TFU9_PASNO
MKTKISARRGGGATASRRRNLPPGRGRRRSRSTSKACHPGDKEALLALSAALGNPYVVASWTPDDPCCEWYGVGCDHSTGRVIDLAAAISGPIPPAIGKLPNLSILIISWTAVSGPCRPSSARSPDLSFNALTGAIPASLAALSGLSGVNLSRNRLTGAIPALFLSKAPDHYLRLSHNNLSGAIPDGFAAVRFAHIDLARNAFTGDASGLLDRAKEVEYLDLSRNAFSFDLSHVELPERINNFDVSHNAMYGGIPPQVANLTNVHNFNVSYNRLCGAVPTGGHMDRFDAYSY